MTTLQIVLLIAFSLAVLGSIYAAYTSDSSDSTQNHDDDG
jgi:hypothetical protein